MRWSKAANGVAVDSVPHYPANAQIGMDDFVQLENGRCAHLGAALCWLSNSAVAQLHRILDDSREPWTGTSGKFRNDLASSCDDRARNGL